MINLNVVIIRRWIQEEVESVFDYGLTDLQPVIGSEEFDESPAGGRIYVFFSPVKLIQNSHRQIRALSSYFGDVFLWHLAGQIDNDQ